MVRICIVLTFILSFIITGISQSSVDPSLDMIIQTSFRQVDWEGNYVWKDMRGAVILKELVESNETEENPKYANSDEAISHTNSKHVQFLKRYLDSNQFVYRLHRNGYIAVEDLYGNSLGKYIKDSNENLVFRKLPRRRTFVSTQRRSF